MISVIKIDSPIGASDHSFISFNLNCNIQSTPPKIKVMYDKGKYKKMRDELCKINWDELFHSHQDDVNAQWELFKNLYEKWRKNVFLEKRFSLTGFNPKNILYH